MEEAVLAIAGLTATVYLPQMAAGEKAVSIYINGRAQEARDLAAALEVLPRRARAALRPAALIALEPLDWDGDFSPGPRRGCGRARSSPAARRSACGARWRQKRRWKRACRCAPRRRTAARSATRWAG